MQIEVSRGNLESEQVVIGCLSGEGSHGAGLASLGCAISLIPVTFAGGLVEVQSEFMAPNTSVQSVCLKVNQDWIILGILASNGNVLVSITSLVSPVGVEVLDFGLGGNSEDGSSESFGEHICRFLFY